THLKQYAVQGHQGIVTCAAFHPDGRSFATGSSDQTVRIWDTLSGQEVQTLTGHTGAVFAVAFSPDGRTLAAGGADLFQPSNPAEVKIWDLESAKELRSLRGHMQQITGLAFTPDGHRLVSSSRDGTVRVWDPQTGQPMCSLKANSNYVN